MLSLRRQTQTRQQLPAHSRPRTPSRRAALRSLQSCARKSPAASDIIIGRNGRLQRLARGMSQSALARTLGVTHQQVQRYERGINRLGGGRLTRIAAVLDVPLAALFAGAEPDGQGSAASFTHLIADRQALRLVQVFTRVQDTAARKVIVALVEVMATRTRIEP